MHLHKTRKALLALALSCSWPIFADSTSPTSSQENGSAASLGDTVGYTGAVSCQGTDCLPSIADFTDHGNGNTQALYGLMQKLFGGTSFSTSQKKTVSNSPAQTGNGTGSGTSNNSSSSLTYYGTTTFDGYTYTVTYNIYDLIAQISRSSVLRYLKNLPFPIAQINPKTPNKMLSNYVQSASNPAAAAPIAGYDITPYAYPLSVQLTKTGMTSVPMSSFESYLNMELTQGNDPSSSLKDQAFCPSNQTASLAITDNCIQPISQLNRVAGEYNTNQSLPTVTNSTSKLSCNAQGDFNTCVPEQYNDFLYDTMHPDVIPSLAAESLLNPLSYSKQSAPDSDINSELGLYGNTQISKASNFIRYLSGTLLPNQLSSDNEYASYQNVANNGTSCRLYMADAAMKLKIYRTLMRTYAAQISVGTSNLYHMMGRRKPTRVDKNGKKVSELYQEFHLATYRIFTPGKNVKEKTPWQATLQKANSTEVQRQMAQLLAEINYQLYLSRQEQERILTTLTAMQLFSVNSQGKKQLSLKEAASYVSGDINVPTISSNQKCPAYQSSSSSN